MQLNPLIVVTTEISEDNLADAVIDMALTLIDEGYTGFPATMNMKYGIRLPFITETLEVPSRSPDRTLKSSACSRWGSMAPDTPRYQVLLKDPLQVFLSFCSKNC